MFRKGLALILGLLSVSAIAQDFKVGQIWEYKTRTGEEASRLYIVKIESWPNGEKIFHIFADKLKIKNPMLSGGIQTELPHAPVSEKSLSLSVTKLRGTAKALPDISEGYGAWKEQHDAGGAGMFTISVSEIITLIEGVVNQNAKPYS